MGQSTKVQVIRRKNSQQWYIGLPQAVIQALALEKGEPLEWVIENSGQLALRRLNSQSSAVEKKSPKD